MSSDDIKLADIHVLPNRSLRAIRDDLIAELAQSMDKHGLLQPIRVRPRSDGGYSFVIGRHRTRGREAAGLADHCGDRH